MYLQNIPQDINIEQLLAFLPFGSYKVSLKGQHGRNAYKDIMDVDQNQDGTLQVNVNRNSIYNILPEFVFHSIDRFSNCIKPAEKDHFLEELEKQEKEKENAQRFFAPIDLLLLLYRVKTREELQPIVETNTVLCDILADKISEEQQNNRFVQKLIPFLPLCKIIRGNKTLLTFLLRKILMEEGLRIRICEQKKEFQDGHSRYSNGLEGTIGDTYVGNVFDEDVVSFEVYYQPIDIDGGFLLFLKDVEIFRQFVQDFFLSVEEILQFKISREESALRLADKDLFYYLNYNTNL